MLFVRRVQAHRHGSGVLGVQICPLLTRSAISFSRSEFGVMVRDPVRHF